eukprot:4705536-Pleurochrysis_carterae.AAC.1
MRVCTRGLRRVSCASRVAGSVAVLSTQRVAGWLQPRHRALRSVPRASAMPALVRSCPSTTARW